jgi:tetratricopeptide (TPR) repeat protein
MKFRFIRLAAIVVAFSGFSVAVRADTVVVVSHPGGSGWQFYDAKKISINGKNKIRLGSPDKTQIEVNEYKNLPSELIGAAPLRAHLGGYLVHVLGNTRALALPDGVSVKGSASAASIWSAMHVQIVTEDTGSKGLDIPTTDIFAILPGSAVNNDVVVDFLALPSNFTGFGEKDSAAAFEERMSLLAFAAGTTTGMASDKLKGILLSPMQLAIQRSKGGVAKLSDLEEGLRFAVVSEKVFPSDPVQKSARDQVRQTKAWLDQRVAILRAFSVSEQWDAFVDKYGEFERFDNSFADVRDLRDKALQESAAKHFAESKRLHSAGEYATALSEIKLAQVRSPHDMEVADFLVTVRVDEAKSHAELVKQKPVDPTSTLQLKLSSHLTFAERYIADGSFSEAEKEIKEAETLDNGSSRVLLTRAKLLRATGHFAMALEVVDDYLRRVSTVDERKIGSDLRDQIDFDKKKYREQLLAQVTKADADGDFVQALNHSLDGLVIDPADVEFLQYAGLYSLMCRKEMAGQEYLQQYLKASGSLLAQRERRAEVMDVLAKTVPPAIEPKGSPNWFSGYNSAPDLFYSPVSLTTNAHPVEVKASRKQMATFQWQGADLLSVRTVTDEPGAPSTSVYFDYKPDGRGVSRVGTEPFGAEKLANQNVRLTSTGAVGPGKGTYVALFNDPQINPYMIERLTGRTVATLVAGNPYFHPFVWSGIYVFLVSYDSEGRVRSATEKHGNTSSPRVLDFAWDGDLLMSITERGDKPGTVGAYRREMHYEGKRLTSEVIHFQGKESKIEYKYNGDKLVEADCSDDPSIDGRNRKVTFRD